MSASPSQTVLRSLRLSVVDGVLHAVMVGTCESYLGALAVELGHRDLSLALLVTVPILSGAASQLFSARLVALLLAKVCAFPLWRRVVDAVGLRRTLLVAGLGVSLVMVPWTAFESFGGLMFAQAFGGAMWAGFELVTLQLLLDSAPERASVEFFSLSSTLTGVLQVCGSLLGSFLLTLPGFEYRTVFATSGILRALALLLLAGAMVGIDFRGSIRLFLRIVSVRPSAGAETGPILGAEKEDRR